MCACVRACVCVRVRSCMCVCVCVLYLSLKKIIIVGIYGSVINVILCYLKEAFGLDEWL